MGIRQVSVYGDLECAWHVVNARYVLDVIVLCSQDCGALVFHT